MKKDNLDAKSNDVHIPFLCNTSYRNITSEASALQTPMVFVDLANPKMNQLLVRGYFDYYGGYAELTREFVFGLLDTYPNYKIKVNALHTPVDIDPIVWQRVTSLTNAPMFHESESIAMIIAGPGYAQEEFLDMQSRYKIIYTMLETLEVPLEIQQWINNCDMCFVPTIVDYNRFDKVANKEVVYPGVDIARYHPDVKPLDVVNLRNKFVFGFVGSWNIRKGIHSIVEAYCKEFYGQEDVALFLCSKYGTRPYGEEKDNADRWSIRYEFDKILNDLNLDKNKMPTIVLNDLPLHENIMPNLYASFDAMVGASLGESIWMPGLVAKTMGIPIIQTDNPCCGYLDYLNSENALLSDCSGFITANEELIDGTSEYYRDQQFGCTDIQSLMRNMRTLYRSKDSLKEHFNRDINTFRDNWSWDKSVTGLHHKLQQIFNT